MIDPPPLEVGDASGGGGCFTAGTIVAIGPGRFQPIGDIRPGDLVLARDEETGETSRRPVVRTWKHVDRPTLILNLGNGEAIETTAAHRLFARGQGFVPAGRLTGQEQLETLSGAPALLSSVHAGEQTSTVYNLSIDDYHTFFVGKTGIWVHNVKDDGTNTSNPEGGDPVWTQDGPQPG